MLKDELQHIKTLLNLFDQAEVSSGIRQQRELDQVVSEEWERNAFAACSSKQHKESVHLQWNNNTKEVLLSLVRVCLAVSAWLR